MNDSELLRCVIILQQRLRLEAERLADLITDMNETYELREKLRKELMSAKHKEIQ